MTIYRKELKQAIKSWGIWTSCIALMMAICILMFPEMKGEMDSISSVFANMGGFSAAFGMDQLNFGELMGFYGVECGNVLGIGGGFFAALAGISVLAGEEKEHTAEFLLTHPVSRFSVLTQKLLSVLTQIIAMNILIVIFSFLSAAIIGESLQLREWLLLHTAYLIMQMEIACICFGISAWIRHSGIGIGLGLALALYFMNIICNISEQAEFLRYITPYAYSEASSILSESNLDWCLIGTGSVFALAGIGAAYLKYTRKDIVS
ncbi:MAG: ABC transporter permease subunit [Ruminococcus sp.]